MSDLWLPSPALTGRTHDWLTRPGSLTAHLRRHCPAFNVLRLRQGHAHPHHDEQDLLHLPRQRWALVREVLLRCGDHPLIFAHSVAPLASIHGPWRALAGLGNRPLGEALFLNPRIVREPLYYRRLDARHPLYRAAAAAILNGHDFEKTALSMKVLPVPLSPNPSPARGEGRIEKSLRDFYANAPRQLWARRARYLLDGAPLLVSEVFLPGLS